MRAYEIAAAHGAGLERDVEVAVDEPLAAERLGRAPDRHHLGMRGRIAVGQSATAGLRDDIAVAHDDAADRHLAGRRRGMRLVEREIHEGVRRHGPGTSPQLCYHAAARAASPTIRQMNRSDDHPAAGERIARVIARAAGCSRREAEAWIAAGRSR